jgi:hypothetical protein
MIKTMAIILVKKANVKLLLSTAVCCSVFADLKACSFSKMYFRLFSATKTADQTEDIYQNNPIYILNIIISIYVLSCTESMCKAMNADCSHYVCTLTIHA